MTDEEMAEEKIFKERFPEYCAGERCLSPYFDLFQAGFEEGEKQAKKIITKLVEGIRIISDPKVYMTDVAAFVSEAEQFLKEIVE